jgi:hypothetical protein
VPLGSSRFQRGKRGTVGDLVAERLSHGAVPSLVDRTVNRPSPVARQRPPRTEKKLHRSVLFQVTGFGGFSAAWTAVALLITGPR